MRFAVRNETWMSLSGYSTIAGYGRLENRKNAFNIIDKNGNIPENRKLGSSVDVATFANVDIKKSNDNRLTMHPDVWSQIIKR